MTAPLGAIGKALIAARGEFKKAGFDAQNPHLRNRYSSLASVMEACEFAMATHGLTFVQPIDATATGPVLRTVLIHADSGETIESTCPILYDKESKLNVMQAFGSAVTYARRYSLASLVGVLSGEEDDGEGAYPRRDRPREGPPRRPDTTVAALGRNQRVAPPTTTLTWDDWLKKLVDRWHKKEPVLSEAEGLNRTNRIVQSLITRATEGWDEPGFEPEPRLEPDAVIVTGADGKSKIRSNRLCWEAARTLWESDREWTKRATLAYLREKLDAAPTILDGATEMTDAEAREAFGPGAS